MSLHIWVGYTIDNLIVIKDDLEYFIEHIIKKKHLNLKNNKNIQDSNLKI